MLKYRLLTALVLIPLVVICILFLPPLTFFSLALLLMLLAGWEWSSLIGIKHLSVRILFLVLLAAALSLAVFIPLYWVVILGIVWWLLALMLLLTYPTSSECLGKALFPRFIMGFLILIPCWIGLIILQGFSPVVLLYCLILIWTVDSTAYFIGRKWGKHKLAPTISPGKSYEGFIAGILAAAIVAFLGLLILDIPQNNKLLFFVTSLLGGGVITVFGDLFESMIKRQSQVKESGSLLPGHGGLLDRIDSLTTAVPFFALIFPYLFNA